MLGVCQEHEEQEQPGWLVTICGQKNYMKWHQFSHYVGQLTLFLRLQIHIFLCYLSSVIWAILMEKWGRNHSNYLEN